MTISATFSVHCTSCGSWAGEEESKRGALKEAKRQGFRRVKVENGSYWDFCPKCYEFHVDEQKEQKRLEGK